MSTEIFNPLDPRLFTDPHPLLDAVREKDPVYYEPALNMFVITGHEEGMAVMRHPGGDHRYTQFQHIRVPGDPEQQPYVQGMREWILMKNGQDHKRIRGAFSRHFTQRRVDDLRPQLERDAHRLIDTFADRGRVDLLAEYATPLPLTVISHLLGVPAGDEHQIEHLIEGFKIAVGSLPMTEQELATANNGISGLQQYFADLIEHRRQHPGNDLLSVLIAESDQGALTPAELIANVWGLYAAGHETSAAAICNGAWLLSNNPDQLDLLRSDWTGRIDQAVEEILRLDSPGQMTVRLFEEDIQVGEHTIPANTPIMIYLLAGNRDPRRWNCPHQFDQDRDPIRDHFGFGQGIHRCLGQHLAKATVGIAIHALFDRLTDLQIDEHHWNERSIFHGPSHMTATFKTRTD